jgi:hypothetical protein
VGEAGVGQRLGDAHVGVVQVDVLADERDLDRLFGRLDAVDEVRATRPSSGGRRQPEVADEVGAEAGLLQHQRHLVDRRGGPHRDHGLEVDVAEEGDLLADLVGDLLVGAADDDVGVDAGGPELTDALLGRLGLELAGAADDGQQRDVDVEDVRAADLAPHLADRLEEGLPLDVADGPADLDDDDVVVCWREARPIRCLISSVMWGMTWIVPPR